MLLCLFVLLCLYIIVENWRIKKEYIMLAVRYLTLSLKRLLLVVHCTLINICYVLLLFVDCNYVHHVVQNNRTDHILLLFLLHPYRVSYSLLQGLGNITQEITQLIF